MTLASILGGLVLVAGVYVYKAAGAKLAAVDATRCKSLKRYSNEESNGCCILEKDDGA